MQQTHCAKRSLCAKAFRATHRVQVYNKRLRNCDIFRPRNCGRKFCVTNNRPTVLHKCAPQLCSTTVLHNCAPQLCSTRAFLSSPLCSLCSPPSPSGFPSSSPNSVSPQSLAPVQAVRAGMGRNWESFQSLEYKSKSKSDNTHRNQSNGDWHI